MKKSRKSKIVLFSVLGLATVSLATVGFASWVISEVTPSDPSNITVSAGSVVDNSLSVSISSSELVVRFDNNNAANGFGNNDNKTEDLEFSFTSTITGSGTISGLKYKFTFDGDFKTELISANYVTSFASADEFTVSTTSEVTGATLQNESTITYDSNSKAFTSRFKFGWGSVFGGDNPSTAYAKASTTDGKATVVSNLNKFDTAAKKVTKTPWLKVVVTPVAAKS